MMLVLCGVSVCLSRAHLAAPLLSVSSIKRLSVAGNVCTQ